MSVREIIETTSQIRSLVKEVCKEESTHLPTWTENVDTVLFLSKQLHSYLRHDIQEIPDRKILTQLESDAVCLWNQALCLKNKESMSAIHNAKIRLAALLLVESSSCGSSMTMDVLKKKIMMGIKTVQALLECKQPYEAEEVFMLTDLYIDQFRATEKEQGGRSIHSMGQECMADIFKLFCLKAECATLQNDYKKTMEMVLIAKDLLDSVSNQAPILSMLCYNFGVGAFHANKYEQCVTWLKEAFSIGKGPPSVGFAKQARTLRLLANAFLEWDPAEYGTKALDAVSLANTEEPHPAGLYLKLRILLLLQEKHGLIQKAVEDVLEQPASNLDVGVCVAELLNQYNRSELANEVVRKLQRKFEHMPEVGRLLLSQLDYFIKSCQEHDAQELVELCIHGHNTGRPLTSDLKMRFHALVWQQAAKYVESEEYKKAIDWYNYSLSIMRQSMEEARNLAKLYRNQATCYLHLKEGTKALELAEQAQKWDSNSIHTQFCLYKVALALSQSEQATKSLQAIRDLCSKEEANREREGEMDVHAVVCLAAQMAIESGDQEAAITALQCLIQSSTDIWQTLTSVRCLIRILLSHENPSPSALNSLLGHVTKAYSRLHQAIDGSIDVINSRVQDEANWFMRIAWNLALQSSNEPEIMHGFFMLSYKFLCFCVADTGVLTRQKTCLLMASAAGLEIAKTTKDPAHRKHHLEKCVENISLCRGVISSLHQQASFSSGDLRGQDTSETLLLLYELEAKLKLHDPSCEESLDRALETPNPDPKIFETLAALAMESPVKNTQFCLKALKVALSKQLQQPMPDYTKCSKLFHSLVHLTLATEGGAKSDAWNCYQEILDLLHQKAQGQFPEMELVWFMTKAWNHGIQLYSCGRYDQSEKWCSVAMKFLRYLSSSRESYENHMNEAYADILVKLDMNTDAAMGSKRKFQEE